MACIQEDIAADSYGRKKAHTSWRGAMWKMWPPIAEEWEDSYD
jgi:hypothetical protein